MAFWDWIEKIAAKQYRAGKDALPIEVTGSKMELYGATINDRPAANAVAIGTTFTITNETLDTWISNGTDWVVV